MNITYRGNSSDDFNLLLCTFEYTTNMESGLSKSVTLGTVNEYRLSPAYSYASYDNTASYTVSFIHKDETPFTKEQIRRINKWLMSYNHTSTLLCSYYSGTKQEEIIYEGLFTNCQYQKAGIGIIGLTYTFQSSSPFCYKQFNKTYSLTEPGAIIIDCDSDLGESFVYPTLSICWNSTETGVDQTTISLTNTSDNNSRMMMHLLDGNLVTVDCQRQIVTDTAGLISFEDMGWADFGEIYWMRLICGKNKLQIDKPCTISISCKIPLQLGEIYEY